jgi:hypothetical protein
VIQNPGQIYAGGGGGGSLGLSYSSPSFPIIGSISLGFGAGGGGGSESGLGGSAPSGTLTLGYYKAGSAAGPSTTSIPGTGGIITIPIPITVSIATITITPNIYGGDGGAFAQSGTVGTANISLSVTIAIPIIGNITLGPYAIPIPVGGAGGTPGLAIERNGNNLQGIADGNYNGYQIKGVVGP